MKQISVKIRLVRSAASNLLFPSVHQFISTRRNFSVDITPTAANRAIYEGTSHSIASYNLKRGYASSTDSKPLAKTPLYDLHIANGGNMVGFAGFLMPVQYSSLSITASHHFTRTKASLFDVSHMVQHSLIGPGATAFLEKITPSDISGLGIFKGGLSAFLWPQTGGIVDDTIITRLGPQSFSFVTNAGCREKDLKYLTNELEVFKKTDGRHVEWRVFTGHGLIALQGPLSEEILSGVLADNPARNLKDLHFGNCEYIKIKLLNGKTSSNLLVTRGGYTGEDGFEISTNPDETVEVTEALLQSAPENLKLAGLGARDSLRLEAGLCLYGHDLNDSTTPVEAGLSWIIGKNRRSAGGFHGAEVILPQLTSASKGGTGVARRRVGLIVQGAPAREGAVINDLSGNAIGNVTSGCPSPTLGKNISMGYIKDGFHRSGTDVGVLVRGKLRKAQVTKMPFTPTNYWKGSVST